MTITMNFTKQTQKDIKENLVVVGHAAVLHAPEVVALLPESAKPLWSLMIESTKPGDGGQAVSTFLPGPGTTRLVGIVLPERCSRHNSRAQPHAITTQLAAHTPPKGDASVILALDHSDDAVAAACAAARAFPLYGRKTSDDDNKTRSIDAAFVAAQGPAVDLARITAIAGNVRRAARLSDTPANVLNTEAFVVEAEEVAKSLGVHIEVIKGEALSATGLGGLYAVGRAASAPPALVLLTHAPKEARETIVWVGKGIVYDTGGLSLKPSASMVGMKGDMGGAAAVLCAFAAAVKVGIRHKLIAVLCLAENAIGPNATRPDDVITLYSGKTIEVNNTDAEGRLVLADGIAYAVKHFNPDVLVDVATLTGAQLVATGKRHAAIVCNDDTLEREAVEAGKISGDLVHPLPYCPEFFRPEFKSEVADLKNAAKDTQNARTSCAAQFVAEHLGEGYQGKWLHLDIAGPAGLDARATGFGVALLTQLFGRPQ